MEEKIDKLIAYVVADFEYKDARNHYEYLLADLTKHDQQFDTPELETLRTKVIETYSNLIEALRDLR